MVLKPNQGLNWQGFWVMVVLVQGAKLIKGTWSEDS